MNGWRPSKKLHLELLGILFLVNLGIALRFRQYLFNRSLWFDEASLALNVVDRDVTTLLTEPLAYLQTAPPGFLVAARSMVVALGPFDWALRLVPFIAGVSVVLLAVILARRELSLDGRQVDICWPRRAVAGSDLLFERIQAVLV